MSAGDGGRAAVPGPYSLTSSSTRRRLVVPVRSPSEARVGLTRGSHARRTLALLCQGLVMAWLAARRKMLPDEVRRRGNPRFGIAFPVASVHVANLYMRCTADLLMRATMSETRPVW